MTKSDLIERVGVAHKVPVGRSEQIVNAIFDAIEQSLNRGDRVEIRGFGSFEVRNYRGYTGRNPRTGSTVDVKPKRLAFFKVGKELKERVQRGALAAAGRRAAMKAPAPSTTTTPGREIAPALVVPSVPQAPARPMEAAVTLSAAGSRR